MDWVSSAVIFLPLSACAAPVARGASAPVNSLSKATGKLHSTQGAHYAFL